VVDEWTAGRKLDRHWRPQHQICDPCYLKYDFIGRFEDLSVDAKHVLNKLTSVKPRLNVSFPTSNAFKGAPPVSQSRESFYANVPHDIVKKLVLLYKNDYELFDYDYHWACNDC